MSDYWDYVKDAMANYGNINNMFQSLYNRAYDDSHGSTRYWLSKVPWLSTWRKYQDESKQAQDRYDNTGVDEAYIDRVIGFSGADFNSTLSGVAGRTMRMARSMATLYVPEVVEDVGSRFNNMYT